MSNNLDVCLDIHFIILIRKYGTVKALEIMKEILPSEYEEAIEQDRKDIYGFKPNESHRPFMFLWHCRHMMNDRQYLFRKAKETDNPMYKELMNYDGDNPDLEDRYLKLIEREYP